MPTAHHLSREFSGIIEFVAWCRLKSRRAELPVVFLDVELQERGAQINDL
jgi:hypothetical protein